MFNGEIDNTVLAIIVIILVVAFVYFASLLFGRNTAGAEQRPASPLFFLGALMVIAGVLAAVYFFVFYDPGMGSPKGGPVINLQRLGEQRNGLTLGIGSALLGALLMIVAKIQNR